MYLQYDKLVIIVQNEAHRTYTTLHDLIESTSFYFYLFCIFDKRQKYHIEDVIFYRYLLPYRENTGQRKTAAATC